jgi:2-polyprenyl-6-methoxyphenol hydroxylase-like FAD-dependent oxidoreductase
MAAAEAAAEAAPDGATSTRSSPGPIRTVAVEVVEKREEYLVRGAAFGLAPNGLKAVRELCPDVAGRLVEEGIHMASTTGGYLLPWYRVRDALWNEAQKFVVPDAPPDAAARATTIRFRMGWSLESIEQPIGTSSGDDETAGQGGGGIRAVFTNGRVLTGDILVAADGIRSKVRSLLDLPPCRQPPASRIWRGHVSVPTDSVLYPYLPGGGVMPLGSMLAGRTFVGAFSFHERHPGTVAWTVSSKEAGGAPNRAHVLDDVLEPHLGSEALSEPPPSPPSGDAGVRGTASQAELIRELFRLSRESDLTTPYDNTVVELPPRRSRTGEGAGDQEEEAGEGWGGRGRVVLIGDAAHAMRPASGVGGSMAFEDAVLLCRTLRKLWWDTSSGAIEGGSSSPSVDGNATSDGDDPVGAALRAFENERLPRVRRIWETEWSIGEAGYAAKPGQRPPPRVDDEYKAWVFGGI